MSRKILPPTPRILKAAPRPPVPPTTDFQGRDLDELTDVTRQARLLDLAIQGLWEFSGHSMVEREAHIEPLRYAAMELHSAVNKLEARIWWATIVFPPQAEAAEKSA